MKAWKDTSVLQSAGKRTFPELSQKENCGHGHHVSPGCAPLVQPHHGVPGTDPTPPWLLHPRQANQHLNIHFQIMSLLLLPPLSPPGTKPFVNNLAQWKVRGHGRGCMRCSLRPFQPRAFHDPVIQLVTMQRAQHFHSQLY